MMLAGVIGACSTAPRQHGLKKPRPLRSFSALSEMSPNQDDGRADSTLKKKMCLESLECNESPDPACGQGSPLSQDTAALGPRYFAFFANQENNGDKCKSLNQQDSSFSSYEYCQVFGRHDTDSSERSAALSMSTNWNTLASTSSDQSLVSQETSYLFQNTSSPYDNMNVNSNDKSFHNTMADGGDCCQPHFDCQDEFSRSFCTDDLVSGRCRYRRVRSPGANRAEVIDKDQDDSQSFQSQSKASTRATLITTQGDELVLTGNNLKSVLQAYRILLKELDAKMVKIETVANDGICDVKSCDIDQSCTGSNMKWESTASKGVQDCFVRRSLFQSWHYSKHRLLRLSMSSLSHKPPPMWNVIANTHSDCCLHATKVREYFDPSAFHYHDGTLVMARPPWEKDRGTNCGSNFDP